MIDEQRYRALIQQLATGGITGNKTYHQYHDQFVPRDSESMGYANGGGVGSMMQPKKKYEDQQLTKKVKPVNQGGGPNYLGKQKEVTVPKKWLSDPNHVVAELAYITPKEQKILLDANIYGSLKGKPNKGPGGVMSLQGDLGGWGGPGGGNTGGGQGGGQGGGNDYKNTDHFKMMTGNLAKGQTVETGPKTKQYSDLPEWVQVLQPDGTYKNKHVASAYKSYGTPSFWGNLFSRGAPGYRGLKGISAFGKNPLKNLQLKGTITPQGNIVGGQYYSDYEGFGETKDAMPFGIMGLISNAINKFKKPKDMSEYNKLGLYDERVNPTYYNDLDNKLALETQPTPSAKYKYSIGPQAVNVPGPYEQAETDYWSDKQVINTPGGEIVIDSEGNEVVDTPMGTPWDNPYQEPKKGVMEKINDFFFTPTGAAEINQTNDLGLKNEMAKLNTFETREYNNLKTGKELNMNSPKQNERLEELEKKKNEANIIGSSTAIV